MLDFMAWQSMLRSVFAQPVATMLNIGQRAFEMKLGCRLNGREFTIDISVDDDGRQVALVTIDNIGDTFHGPCWVDLIDHLDQYCQPLSASD